MFAKILIKLLSPFTSFSYGTGIPSTNSYETIFSDFMIVIPLQEISG